MLATHGHAIPITTITTMHLYSHAGNTHGHAIPITTITTMHLYSHAGNAPYQRCMLLFSIIQLATIAETYQDTVMTKISIMI